MNYKITTDVSTINKKSWSDFVYNHPYGNVFQTPEMYELYKQTELYEPIALFSIQEDNTISGVLLAVIVKEKKGIVGKFSSRSIIWGGPLVLQNNTEICHELLKSYDLLTRNRVIYSQFRNTYDLSPLKDAFIRNGYKYEDHLNILINLTKGEEKLWSEIHKYRRKEINKGNKKGVTSKELEIISESKLILMYKMLINLYKKIGLPIPSFDFFNNAFNILFQKGMLRCFIAFFNEKIIAFRFVLTYRGLIYDWYAASNSDYSDYRPNDILPWEIFKWGHKNKFLKFDFGGAGKPNIKYGVRDYKLRFGGEIVDNGRFQKINYRGFYFLGSNIIMIKKMLKNAII